MAGLVDIIAAIAKGAASTGGRAAGATGALAGAHWSRNKLNQVPSPEEVQATWKQLPPEQSIYHTQGPEGAGNRKFISPSGHSEAVISPAGTIVTDPTNMGTFNVANPETAKGIPHGIFDVLPYYALGNTPKDMFSPERFKTTIGAMKKVGQ